MFCNKRRQRREKPAHCNQGAAMLPSLEKSLCSSEDPARYAMLCYAKSLPSCPTMCDPIEGSPPGSPVPGILQARTLEWVAILLAKDTKLMDQRQKTIVHSTANSMSFMFVSFSRVLQVPQGNVKCPT